MEISTFVGKLCINILEKRGPFFMTFSPSLLTFSSHPPLTPQMGHQGHIDTGKPTEISSTSKNHWKKWPSRGRNESLPRTNKQEQTRQTTEQQELKSSAFSLKTVVMKGKSKHKQNTQTEKPKNGSKNRERLRKTEVASSGCMQYTWTNSGEATSKLWKNYIWQLGLTSE